LGQMFVVVNDVYEQSSILIDLEPDFQSPKRISHTWSRLISKYLLALET
jgi:hypothetical protein